MAEPEEEAPSILFPCSICSRTFKPESLKKHAKVCERNATKKRKAFDSSKQRIQGTELAEFLPSILLNKKNEKVITKKTQSKWKEKHLEFVRAIRAARGVENVPHKSISSATVFRPSNHERCPHCDRNFGPKAFDRHIEWCKEQKARIPKSPASIQAKERLDARTKYRAPILAKSKRTLTREKYAPNDVSPMGRRTSASSSGLLSSQHQLPAMAEMPTIPSIRGTGTKSQGQRNAAKGSMSSPACSLQRGTRNRSSNRQRSASPVKRVSVSSPSNKNSAGKREPVNVKIDAGEEKDQEDLFSSSCNITKLQLSGSSHGVGKARKPESQNRRPSVAVTTKELTRSIKSQKEQSSASRPTTNSSPTKPSVLFSKPVQNWKHECLASAEEEFDKRSRVMHPKATNKSGVTTNETTVTSPKKHISKLNNNINSINRQKIKLNTIEINQSICGMYVTPCSIYKSTSKLTTWKDIAENKSKVERDDFGITQSCVGLNETFTLPVGHIQDQNDEIIVSDLNDIATPKEIDSLSSVGSLRSDDYNTDISSIDSDCNTEVTHSSLDEMSSVRYKGEESSTALWDMAAKQFIDQNQNAAPCTQTVSALVKQSPHSEEFCDGSTSIICSSDFLQLNTECNQNSVEEKEAAYESTSCKIPGDPEMNTVMLQRTTTLPGNQKHSTPRRKWKIKFGPKRLNKPILTCNNTPLSPIEEPQVKKRLLQDLSEKCVSASEVKEQIAWFFNISETKSKSDVFEEGKKNEIKLACGEPVINNAQVWNGNKLPVVHCKNCNHIVSESKVVCKNCVPEPSVDKCCKSYNTEDILGSKDKLVTSQLKEHDKYTHKTALVDEVCIGLQNICFDPLTQGKLNTSNKRNANQLKSNVISTKCEGSLLSETGSTNKQVVCIRENILIPETFDKNDAESEVISFNEPPHTISWHSISYVNTVNEMSSHQADLELVSNEESGLNQYLTASNSQEVKPELLCTQSLSQHNTDLNNMYSNDKNTLQNTLEESNLSVYSINKILPKNGVEVECNIEKATENMELPISFDDNFVVSGNNANVNRIKLQKSQNKQKNVTNSVNNNKHLEVVSNLRFSKNGYKKSFQLVSSSSNSNISEENRFEMLNQSTDTLLNPLKCTKRVVLAVSSNNSSLPSLYTSQPKDVTHISTASISDHAITYKEHNMNEKVLMHSVVLTKHSHSYQNMNTRRLVLPHIPNVCFPKRVTPQTQKQKKTMSIKDIVKMWVSKENAKRNASDVELQECNFRPHRRNAYTKSVGNHGVRSKMVRNLPPLQVLSTGQASSNISSSSEESYDPYLSAERQMLELLSHGDCHQDLQQPSRPIQRSAPISSNTAPARVEAPPKSAFARYTATKPQSQPDFIGSTLSELEDLFISGHSKNSFPSSNSRINFENNNMQDIPINLTSLGLNIANNNNNNIQPGQRKISKIRAKMENAALLLQRSVSVCNYENVQVNNIETNENFIIHSESKSNLSSFSENATSFSSPDSKPILPSSRSLQLDNEDEMITRPKEESGMCNAAVTSEDEELLVANNRRSIGSKFSADSAYSSLNRRSPHTHSPEVSSQGQVNVDTGAVDMEQCTLMSSSSSESSLPPLCSVQVVRCESKSPSLTPTPPLAIPLSPDQLVLSKMPKFCHECGSKYPVSLAKFCCECGVRRLVI